jgi:hypothetical protein
MVAEACTIDIGCDPNAVMPMQIIPVEYQGWILLTFLCYAIIAILCGFAIMVKNPVDNTIVDNWEPKKRKLYDRLFMELMMLVMLGLFASFIMMRMGI